MARPDKVAVVDQVRERLSSSTATVLTEYRGLTVTELAQLRTELRKSDATYAVVKNTLTRRAAADAGMEVPDSMLVGPTAITFCNGDPVAAAKVLRTFSKDHPDLVIKGGLLDGKLLDAAETLQLADLESREELLAKLAGLFQTIIAQPARLAQANLSKAARLFAALQEKKPEEAASAEAPAAPVPPAAPADTEPESPEAAASADADTTDETAATADSTEE